MTNSYDVMPTLPVTVLQHPATRKGAERSVPAFPPPRDTGDQVLADPAFAPWTPHARFAPPGPHTTALTAPRIVMRLDGPVVWPAKSVALGAEPSTRQERQRRSRASERDAIPVAEAPVEPAPALESHRATEPEPLLASDLADDAPVAPSVYWATPSNAAPGAESLAWTPPPPATEPAGVERSAPAAAGLWSAEPVPTGQEFGTPPTPRARRLDRRRVATLAGGGAALLAACVAGVLILPRLLTGSGIPAATFNAPMMVLRAAVVGRVAAVAVTNGQSVEPSTLLLTIHTEPQPDPAMSLLQDRLEAARGRLAALDDALTQPTPNTDAGRARVADLRSQRAAAANDMAQLRDAAAHMVAPLPADQPVKAGVHGVIRSLEAQAGTPTAAGVPLVRMLDCDHAFLTVAPGAPLHAGEAVQVRLPNLPAVAATVRNSAGIAEPPNSLVIAPAPGAFVAVLSGSCPIGATATVTPSLTGS